MNDEEEFENATPQDVLATADIIAPNFAALMYSSLVAAAPISTRRLVNNITMEYFGASNQNIQKEKGSIIILITSPTKGIVAKISVAQGVEYGQKTNEDESHYAWINTTAMRVARVFTDMFGNKGDKISYEIL